MVKKNKIYKLLSKGRIKNYTLTVKSLKVQKDKVGTFHNTNIFNTFLYKNPYHGDSKKSNNK